MAMLTLTEAAKRMGFSYICLWTWVKAKKIPYYDINGSYRVDEKELEKFLKKSKVEIKEKGDS